MCAAYRIPHESVFLAEWTEGDRQKAIAWHIRQAAMCGGCGTRREEWIPEQGGHRHAYIAEPDICPGCEKRERVEEDVRKKGSDWEGQRGVAVRLRPNPKVKRGGGRGGARRRNPRA